MHDSVNSCGQDNEPCNYPTATNSLLYVEDDNFAREVTCKLISLGFPEFVIHQAENGHVGLDLFKEHRHRIVITDINMPVMNGIQMSKKIREIAPNACIIVVTAHSDKYYLDEITRMGISHFVLKPIDHKRLFEAIEICRASSGMKYKEVNSLSSTLLNLGAENEMPNC